MLRQPICVFMGHVDHGKTSIADQIRHTAVAQSEAGAITQMISSSALSIDSIRKTCEGLISPCTKFTVPGLLLIDTPGHAAFTNLRKRGGNLADIAVLVIDIHEGLMPQTLECIEILKQYKTPFVIALNKIDLLNGWQQRHARLLENINAQQEAVKQQFEARLYGIVGQIYERGFQSDRFDRVGDYTKQVAIVPCSAKTREGIPELLMVIIGLAQRYLEQSLEVEQGPGKATVLEVKEEKGIGTVLDAILYDGTLKQGDTIVIGNIGKPIVTKVRGMLVPEKGKLKGVKEISAAAGVRISAPDLSDVIPGVPLQTSGKNLEETKHLVQAEVEEVTTEVDEEGILIKAESLGSLEALSRLLKDKGIMIKRASVGPITRKDFTDAEADANPFHKVILAFNIIPPEQREGVRVISSDVIYHIIEEYEKWVIEEKKKQEAKNLEDLTRPAKMQIIRGCIFRQSNPAVVGVVVLGGTVKANVDLIKADGSRAGTIKSIEMENEAVEKAEKGREAAISLPGIIAKRQIDEEDILMVDMNESNFRELKKYKDLLSHEEVSLLKELAEIKRKENPLWGV